MRIDEAEAPIARRIYQEYAARRSPRAIANLAQVYRAQVERLHQAFTDPGLRDEALDSVRRLAVLR